MNIRQRALKGKNSSMAIPTPLPLPNDELAAWLRLATARGLSPETLRALLAAFGLPQRLFAQSFTALAAVAGEKAARAVLMPPAPGFAQQLDALAEWRSEPDCTVLTLADPAYPQRLLTTPDPPPLLYVKGQIERLYRRGIAVIGSRSATPQGLDDAQHFARAFSAAGFVVVSGMALGIDGAAHGGALDVRDEFASGGTVAVFGTGIDVVYPSRHRALADQIVARGALLSEWPLGTPARPANFPQRNRLIAGLVEGVVIVEATERSGSLITARLANEMGRDVFALPGSIHAPCSRGCHRLLKEGAQLVETPDEVMEALGVLTATASLRSSDPAKKILRHPVTHPLDVQQRATRHPVTVAQKPLPLSPSRTPLNAESQQVLAALGHTATAFETLAERTGMNEATLQSALLRLELSGHLCTLPGGWFARVGHQRD